jgi:hypothetical protein
MTLCPIHKVKYTQAHAPCMRKYMGIPDPGGPVSGDGLVPQDILDELKKRGIAPRLRPTPTDANMPDADDKEADTSS